ncbi:hypothetical protein GGX14DRAFT_396247 [Mycena pura]|uniref:Uncharacterized protein n=1 Tax=Mycena pura TaxID=153505 RepID=A0AAD6YA87_9AGAR|nr:hypothetical protein GGX14DRAFT_396247 [Mycena pura]
MYGQVLGGDIMRIRAQGTGAVSARVSHKDNPTKRCTAKNDNTGRCLAFLNLQSEKRRLEGNKRLKKKTTKCQRGNKIVPRKPIKASVGQPETAWRPLASGLGLRSSSRALYLESSSSFWTPPSRKMIVECRARDLNKTKHAQGYNVEKEQLEAWSPHSTSRAARCLGSALYLESSSRDLGFPALSRERLELLPPVAKVDGEQLEPLGSALSSRPQYIVDLLFESSSRLGFRALETWGSALYLESSSSFWTQPVAMVDGEQLEPLGSALSPRPQYIVVAVAWLKVTSSSRAARGLVSALYIESSSRLGARSISKAARASRLRQLPWWTESSSFGLRALLSTAIPWGSGVAKVTFVCARRTGRIITLRQVRKKFLWLRRELNSAATVSNGCEEIACVALRRSGKVSVGDSGSALYLESSSGDLGLRALSGEQLELQDSALPEKDSGVPSTAKYLTEQGMKRNDGVPKGKQGMYRVQH